MYHLQCACPNTPTAPPSTTRYQVVPILGFQWRCTSAGKVLKKFEAPASPPATCQDFSMWKARIETVKLLTRCNNYFSVSLIQDSDLGLSPSSVTKDPWILRGRKIMVISSHLVPWKWRRVLKLSTLTLIETRLEASSLWERKHCAANRAIHPREIVRWQWNDLWLITHHDVSLAALVDKPALAFHMLLVTLPFSKHSKWRVPQGYKPLVLRAIFLQRSAVLNRLAISARHY